MFSDGKAVVLVNYTAHEVETVTRRFAWEAPLETMVYYWPDGLHSERTSFRLPESFVPAYICETVLCCRDTAGFSREAGRECRLQLAGSSPGKIIRWMSLQATSLGLAADYPIRQSGEIVHCYSNRQSICVEKSLLLSGNAEMHTLPRCNPAIQEVVMSVTCDKDVVCVISRVNKTTYSRKEEKDS